MKQRFQRLTALMTALIAAMTLAVSATAANEVNFVVSPVLPENQKPGIKGYFDLLVHPGQEQELLIKVTNGSGEEIVLDVEAITASTNLNGVVNYATPGTNHPTLPHAISDLITIEEPVIAVPPNATKTFGVTVTLPEEEYDGYLLGAIHVTKRLSQEELDSGQTILNQYSYVISIKLTETDAVIEADFSLEDVQAELVNGRASIVNQIANPRPILVKEMNTHVKIYPKGSDTPIMERTMEDTEMAPNSIFPLTLMDNAGYGVKAGTYLSMVELEYRGKTWTFEREFVIKPEEAAAINNSAVNLETRQTAMTSGMPLWALMAIVVGSLLLLALLAVIVIMTRRMKGLKQNGQ